MMSNPEGKFKSMVKNFVNKILKYPYNRKYLAILIMKECLCHFLLNRRRKAFNNCLWARCLRVNLKGNQILLQGHSYLLDNSILEKGLLRYSVCVFCLLSSAYANQSIR